MFARITLALFFLLLVWGNLVAGMKAGLACPDWPLCHGRVLPPFRLDIWMEFGHRLIAATATVSLLVLAWQRFKHYRGAAKAVPVAAVAIIAVEIILGGLVVVLELPVQLTTVHFMTGLTVFLLVAYMAAFDGRDRIPAFAVRGRSGLLLALGALIFSQGALGAYVRHSGSGLACTDFPTCGGHWLPRISSAEVLAQFSHRAMGAVIVLTFFTFWLATLLDGRLGRHRATALLLAVLATAQVGIGGVVVLSGLSYVMTAVHLAMALLLILLLGRMWVVEMTEGERPSTAG